jgi:hypothetical protein
VAQALACGLLLLLLAPAFQPVAFAQSSFGAGNGLSNQAVGGSGCTSSGMSLLKGNGSGGCGNAASGTDYAPATSGTAIQKGNGIGGFSSAASGSDYAPATSGTAIQKGNGSGGFSSAASGTDYQAPIPGNSLGAHNFANGINSAGTISGAQPAFGDLTGTASAGQVPYSGGMQFGSTQLSSTSTAPTSGQCLAYNGTGITGAACSGTSGVVLCNNVSGTSGGSFTCKQSLIGGNLQNVCYLNNYFNSTGTPQTCSFTANGGSAFASAGNITSNVGPFAAILTGTPPNSISLPINMQAAEPGTVIVEGQ